MGSFSINSCLVTTIIAAVLVVSFANGQLTGNFYSTSCPNLASIVRTGMQQAIQTEARMGASILRMFFHDCFAGGCDGSILLDDTATFTGEQTALPNANSIRGFNVIGAIKTSVEAACKATVSCADILALAAKEGANQLGGPTWTVLLGRRDSTTAFLSAANTQIPSPFENLTTLIPKFTNKGLSARDMTALSGAHTIGQARCLLFRGRIYNETNIDPNFATTRKATCPATPGNGDNNLAPLDILTPVKFDNNYYIDLVNKRGLLHSDQVLFNGGSQDALTRSYSNNAAAFITDFVAAMIRLGNVNPLTGTNGEIRNNCSAIN